MSRTTRFLTYSIALVALAASYFWQHNYYTLLEDYEHLQRLFYLQKDNGPGIAIPYPWSQPRGNDVI